MRTDYPCCAARSGMGGAPLQCRGRMVDHKTVLRCNVCAREAAPETTHG